METDLYTKKKKHWLNRNILGMGLADFFSDTNHEMVSAILPIFLSTTLGAPAFALGLVEGIADGVSTLFEVWSGWYSDKIGKRKGLAAVGYAIITISMGTFAFATSWVQVIFGRTLGWIGWSVRSPVRDALLLESTEPETVGRAFAFHGVMDTLGAIAGPLIATLLLSHVPIRDIFLIAAIPGACAFFSVLFFVKEKFKLPNTNGAWTSIRHLSPDYFKFLIPVGIFGISNFAPTFFVLRSQELLAPHYGLVLASTMAVGLYTFGNVIYALVDYPVGVLLDGHSKKAVLTVGYAIFGLLCFGFAHALDGLAFLAILFAFNGVYTAIIESAEPSFASTFMRDGEHGAAYGMLSATQGTGDFLSSIIIGTVWTFVSPVVGFALAGVVAIIAAILLYGLVPARRTR